MAILEAYSGAQVEHKLVLSLVAVKSEAAIIENIGPEPEPGVQWTDTKSPLTLPRYLEAMPLVNPSQAPLARRPRQYKSLIQISFLTLYSIGHNLL